MKTILKVLLLLLLPLSLCSQVQTSIYAYLGARATNTDGATFKEGPDWGLGIELFPLTNSYSGPTWYAHGRITYNSLYVAEYGKYRAAHFKGGFGMTDGRNVFAALNMGYLFGVDERAGTSATVDVSIRLRFPVSGRFVPYMEAYGGSTLTSVFPTPSNSNAYLGGAVGLTYKLTQ